MIIPRAHVAWLLRLASLVLFIGIVAADSVVLYDTENTKWANWTTQPRKGGWTKQSVAGSGRLSYGLCSFGKDDPDNWIRSTFVPRQDGRSVHIEIHFRIRSCKKYFSNRLKHCEDTLRLYYYEADDPSDVPAFSDTSFKYQAPIAPNKKWDDSSDVSFVNKVSQSIRVTRRGLYIALRDSGACAGLLRIRMFYLVCPAHVQGFIKFPRTASHHGYDVRDVSGRCVPGAQVRGSRQPSKFCKANGEWHVQTEGLCECKPGYSAVGNSTCLACPRHYYKAVAGREACQPCPQHSGSMIEGVTACTCLHGFYRNSTVDKANAPCTKPPSAPRALRILSNDEARLELIWDAPASLGGRSDLYYEISCDTCPNNLKYLPGSRLTTVTRVTILGLLPNTFYRFYVAAKNGVSELAARETFGANPAARAVINVNTKPAVPNKIVSLRVKVQGLDSIKVEWSPPNGLSPADIESYQLKMFPSTDKSKAVYFFTERQEYHLKNLQQRTLYSIQIRTKTRRGWGDYSDPLNVKTGSNFGNLNNVLDPDGGFKRHSLLIGIPVAVAVLFLIALIVFLLARKGHLRNKMGMNEKKSPTECSMIPYSNIVFPPNTVRTYVDPHTYEDPNAAIREFAKEIEPTWITIESVIGGGEFGDVCRGRLRLPSKPEGPVAIKTLKAGASEKNRQDFLWEASIMGQFDNPNVIALLGVVTKAQPVMIITEFMENGSLDCYLRAHDGQLTPLQLVGMLRGIASGMRYLAGIGYVHRDLAARNILVDSSLFCKVADFGLSREVEISTDSSTDGAYTTKGGKIPVRWTAPEAIHYRKFTSASDVWSFGVLMWEVMSFGERPYWNWSNQDVIEAIEKSYRLPAPMGCPEVVHQLMLQCWHYDRRARPRFENFVEALDQMIRCPDQLRLLANCTDDSSSTRPLLATSSSMGSVHRWDSVASWLTSLKLERYISLFLHHGITTMDYVLQLSRPDLVQMGIHPVGHQKKILESIAVLRSHLQETQLSDGFLV